MLIALGAVLASSLLQDSLTTEISFTNNAESKRADDLLEKSFPEATDVQELVIVRSQTLSVDDPAFQERLDQLADDLALLQEEGIVEKVIYYGPEVRQQMDNGRQIPAILRAVAATLRQQANTTVLASYLQEGRDGLQEGSDKLAEAADGLQQSQDNPTATSQGLLQAADSFQAAAEGLDQAERAFQAAAEILDQSIPELEVAADGLQQVADLVKQSVDGPEQEAGGFMQTAGSDQQQTQDLDQYAYAVWQKAAEAQQQSNQLKDSANRFRQEASKLRDNAREMRDQAANVPDINQRLAELEAQEAELREQSDSLSDLVSGLNQLALLRLGSVPESFRQAATSFQMTVDGLQQADDGLNKALRGFRQNSSTGLYTAADGLRQSADGLQKAVDGLLQVRSADLAPYLDQLSDDLRQTANSLRSIADQNKARIAQLTQDKPFLWFLQVAALQVPTGLAEYLESQLSAGADQASGGATQLAQLDSAIEELRGGITQARDFATQIEDGVAQLADGARQAKDGAKDLNTGVTQVNDAMDQAQVAANEATAGIVQLENGATVVESQISQYEMLMISPDRHTTLVSVTMVGNMFDAADNVLRLREAVGITTVGGDNVDFDVTVTGMASVAHDFLEISDSDLKKGDSIGIPVALVVLAIVFGALVAAVIPMIMGGIAIAVALGIAALAGLAFDLSFTIQNVIFMLGLAVGIDYSLFIISRYREERREGRQKTDAIAAAGSTAGRAVLFSGFTVVLAVMGIAMVPTNEHRSLALGAIAVVIIAVSAALTLLPAILSVIGDRINSLRLPFIKEESAKRKREEGGGFWDWMTRRVMDHPVISLALSAGLLAACAIPALNMHLGNNDVNTLPEGMPSKAGLEVLIEEFSPGLLVPAQIVIDKYDRPEVKEATHELQAALANDADFKVLRLEVNPEGDVALMSVLLTGDPYSPEASNVINKLREDYVHNAFRNVHTDALVTGVVAMNADFTHITDIYTPFVFTFVLGLSFILLMVAFRSVVIPLKAILMNLLSVAAAWGLIVLVFQEGVGESLFGFQKVEAIETWLPLFLFCVLFGLSMDYHVFLQSRIRERFDQTQNNRESVTFGVRTTAGLITGAALIMVVVFGAFSTGDLVMFQELGFGLAVAVLMDATIVRIILVPSLMRLLGNANWFFPSWLKWIPDLRVEPKTELQAPASKVSDEQPDWDVVILS